MWNIIKPLLKMSNIMLVLPDDDDDDIEGGG